MIISSPMYPHLGLPHPRSHSNHNHIHPRCSRDTLEEDGGTQGVEVGGPQEEGAGGTRVVGRMAVGVVHRDLRVGVAFVPPLLMGE